MGKGKLSITCVTTRYQYENGNIIVMGQVSRLTEDNRVSEFTGTVNKPGENGVPGELIGNFRGVQRGKKMNYSLNEMTLDNQDTVQAAIREIEPQLITIEAEAEQPAE